MMRQLFRSFIRYLNAVFMEGPLQFVFTFLEILSIVTACSPSLAEYLTSYGPWVRPTGVVMFFLFFMLANFRVYHRKLYVEGATIHLDVVEKHFGPSSGSRHPFRGIRRSPHGFNQQGLPDFASLHARIEIANIGHEDGVLRWEFDIGGTKLPQLFDPNQTILWFHPSTHVPARKLPSCADLFFDVLWTVQDPGSFARELKRLIESKASYKVVVRYWTKRVDGETKPRELRIEGDFEQLYEDILKHWDSYRYVRLADLARID